MIISNTHYTEQIIHGLSQNDIQRPKNHNVISNVIKNIKMRIVQLWRLILCHSNSANIYLSSSIEDPIKVINFLYKLYGGK